jgi:Zn-dependent metalloprotease
MSTIPHTHICGVIPDHILTKIAARSPEARAHALSTLEQMRGLVPFRTIRPLTEGAENVTGPQKSRRVYDAQHKTKLPGKLVMDEHTKPGKDIQVIKAFTICGRVYDFYYIVFDRSSIDGLGKRLDSIVHYDRNFDNAYWDGLRMIYGDGDRIVFGDFMVPDVICHEITHGHTQYISGLGYYGQTGALNESISDVFGSMFKQWLLGQSSADASWLIGEGVFAPDIQARGIRSLAMPGTAYDDPVLGKDPQPAHMSGYVKTRADNGGVHINSGIPNHVFYIVATSLGGNSWQTPGQIWFESAARLRPDATFIDFARATVDVAGEEFGNGGNVQETVAQAWAQVGIDVPIVALKAMERRPVSSRKPIARHTRSLRLAA